MECSNKWCEYNCGCYCYADYEKQQECEEQFWSAEDDEEEE